MNDRIQELVKECETTSTTYFDGRGNVTSTDFDRYKFAELIVQECVLISRTSTDGFSAGRRMSEHFGVKE